VLCLAGHLQPLKVHIHALLGRYGLVFMKGKEHRETRRIILKILSPSIVSRRVHVVEEVIARHFEMWNLQVCLSFPISFSILPFLSVFSLERHSHH